MKKTLKELIGKQLAAYDVDADETVDVSDRCPVFLIAAGSVVYCIYRTYIKVDDKKDVVISETYTPYDISDANWNDIVKFVEKLNASVRAGKFLLPTKTDPFLRYSVTVSGDEIRKNAEDATLKLISLPATLIDVVSPAVVMLLLGRITVPQAVADALSAVKSITRNHQYVKRLFSKRKGGENDA